LLRKLESASLPPKSLNNFILRLGEQLNEQDLLKTAVEEARKAIDTERVIIYSFDADWYGTVIAESVLPGVPKALHAKIKDPCFAQEYAQKYYHGRIQSLDNIYEAKLTDCHREQLEKFAVKASLVVSIISNNKLFGLLIAHQCSHPRSWQQSDIDLFAQLAVQVGWALQANSTNRQSLPQIKEEAQIQIEAEITSIENQNKFESTFKSQETRKLPEATLVNNAIEITPQQQQQASKLLQNTCHAFENLFVEATQQSEAIANLLKQMQTAKDSAQAITVSLESLKQDEILAQNKQVRSNKITLNHNLVTLQAMTIEANTTIMQIGDSSQKLLQMGSLINKQIKQQATAPSSESSPNSLISIAERVSPLTNRLTQQTKQTEALIKRITLEVKQIVNLLESDEDKILTETETEPEITSLLSPTTAVNTKINDLIGKIAQAVEQTQHLAFINQFILQVATLAINLEDKKIRSF
ncbi:MAG: GAF domain-containing protein, partial [Xenococcaceae cyanobacterium]